MTRLLGHRAFPHFLEPGTLDFSGALLTLLWYQSPSSQTVWLEILAELTCADFISSVAVEDDLLLQCIVCHLPGSIF